MNWYKLFYWVSVADGVKHFFDWWSDFLTWFVVLSLILYGVMTICMAIETGDANLRKGEEDNDAAYRAFKMVRDKAFAIFKLSLILSLIMWICYILVPTKKDALIIIAGGAVGNFITSDSSAKNLPAEATLLLREEIGKEIRHLRADTLVSSTVDTLKGKSKEELIELIKEKSK